MIKTKKRQLYHPLPAADLSQIEECVEISFCLPCDDTLLSIVRGIIFGLGNWTVWERDEEKRATQVAQCIKQWLNDTYEEC